MRAQKQTDRERERELRWTQHADVTEKTFLHSKYTNMLFDESFMLLPLSAEQRVCDDDDRLNGRV